VAVDGVCLTVMEVLPQGLSLPRLQKLSAVQLWDSCRWTMACQLRNVVAGWQQASHFVMGHVDGIGCLQALQQTATWEMSFTSPDAIAVTSFPGQYCHQWREPNRSR